MQFPSSCVATDSSVALGTIVRVRHIFYIVSQVARTVPVDVAESRQPNGTQ